MSFNFYTCFRLDVHKKMFGPRQPSIYVKKLRPYVHKRVIWAETPFKFSRISPRRCSQKNMIWAETSFMFYRMSPPRYTQKVRFGLRRRYLLIVFLHGELGMRCPSFKWALGWDALRVLYDLSAQMHAKCTIWAEMSFIFYRSSPPRCRQQAWFGLKCSSFSIESLHPDAYTKIWFGLRRPYFSIEILHLDVHKMYELGWDVLHFL